MTQTGSHILGRVKRRHAATGSEVVVTPGGHGILFSHTIFHALSGAGMAMAYCLIIAPRFRVNRVILGSLFGLVPWLINSFVVLPLLDRGIFGVNVLSPGGIVAFFGANEFFFVSVAVLFD